MQYGAGRGRRLSRNVRWGASVLWVLFSSGSLASCGGDEPKRTNPDDHLVDLPPVDPDPTPEPAPGTLMPRDPDEPEPTPPLPDPVTNGTSPIAGECTLDRDCVAGLRCITSIGQSTSGRQSIAGGYCSRVCTVDGDCADFGDGSYCYIGLYMAPEGFCTAPCNVAAPEAEKCNGRTDLTCYGLAGEVGTCNPACGNHEDCDGAYCGFGTGQCQTDALDSNAPPVGSICPEGEPVSCNGFCVGDPGQDGVCTGPCRLGVACGNDPQNRCVPSDPNLRAGDFGFCERTCETSADCTEGLTVCAPTGFRDADGALEHTCTKARPVPTNLPTYLSVEQLALPDIPPNLVGVHAYGTGDTVYQLTTTDAGICVTGTVDAAGSPVVLVLQFGTNDAVPFDASAFQAFLLDQTSPTTTVLFQAQLTSHPGVFYRNEPYDVPVSVEPADGQTRIPFADMQPYDAGAPPWDPSQLEAVSLIIATGDAAGPFDVCLAGLTLE